MEVYLENFWHELTTMNELEFVDLAAPRKLEVLESAALP
jgi:hypothetical protein